MLKLLKGSCLLVENKQSIVQSDHQARSKYPLTGFPLSQQRAMPISDLTQFFSANAIKLKTYEKRKVKNVRMSFSLTPMNWCVLMCSSKHTHTGATHMHKLYSNGFSKRSHCLWVTRGAVTRQEELLQLRVEERGSGQQGEMKSGLVVSQKEMTPRNGLIYTVPLCYCFGFSHREQISGYAARILPAQLVLPLTVSHRV